MCIPHIPTSVNTKMGYVLMLLVLYAIIPCLLSLQYYDIKCMRKLPANIKRLGVTIML